MNKLFENKTTYNKETYINFLKFHGKTFNFSYILYTVVFSLLLILCMYLSFGSGQRIQGVILTLILLCFIGYRLYKPKRIVSKELKSDKISTNNTNTFSFYDSKFIVKNKNGSFEYKYFSLYRIYETSDFFYLYITRENAFLISKNTFSLRNCSRFCKIFKK